MNKILSVVAIIFVATISIFAQTSTKDSTILAEAKLAIAKGNAQWAVAWETNAPSNLIRFHQVSIPMPPIFMSWLDRKTKPSPKPTNCSNLMPIGLAPTTGGGAANESKGNFATSLDDFEKGNELSDKPTDKKDLVRNQFRQVRVAFEKSGPQGYWQKSLEIVKNEPDEKKDYYFIAICYAQLGDKENALNALEKAFETKSDQIDVMKVEPYFDSLKSEPRFKALLRRIGLEP